MNELVPRQDDGQFFPPAGRGDYLIDPTVGDVMRRSQSNLRKLAVWTSVRFESSPPRCLPASTCRSEVRKHRHTRTWAGAVAKSTVGRDRLFRETTWGPWCLGTLAGRKTREALAPTERRLPSLGPGHHRKEPPPSASSLGYFPSSQCQSAGRQPTLPQSPLSFGPRLDNFQRPLPSHHSTVSIITIPHGNPAPLSRHRSDSTLQLRYSRIAFLLPREKHYSE